MVLLTLRKQWKFYETPLLFAHQHEDILQRSARAAKNRNAMKKFIVILLLASSCAPVYVPNLRNSPVFTKAGEVQVSGSIGRSYEAQAGVAVTNHIGVTGGFSYVNNTTVDDTDDYLRHKFFEGGIGYFENAGKFCYEVYAGYGRGEGKSYDNNDITSGELAIGKYQRFYIQPAIGMNKHRIFNWSAMLRFSFVDFTSFESGGVIYTERQDPVLFIEPGFMGRVNFGNSKMFMTFQAGVSFPQRETYFDHEPVSAGIGLGLRFGALRNSE